MNIVIVEDDVLLAKNYTRLLTKAGYTVHHASHGVAAIKLIDKVLPGVIILDMLLTGSTAMPLLHELRSYEDLATIPVIMITNLAGGVSIDELRPYGVHRLLDKSTMEPADITAAVRSIEL